MTWDELNAVPLEERLSWLGPESWCRDMALCAQDADYHSEGDVWTHAKLVCRQVEQLEQWQSLTGYERTVLTWTALLHDAGKPLTSQLDPTTGRISSPKHAVKGEHLARSVLRDLGCPLVLREEICRMVRFHGRPAFLLEKPEPSHEVVWLSWMVANRLLYLFALADTRGRTTSSYDRPEENLHLFKMAAEEQDCFRGPYPFANDQARFLYYRKDPPNLFYVPHEDYRCTVTMMSGLPGSGKDTWLEQQGPDVPFVSLDDIRSQLDLGATDEQGAVIQAARERCREFLRARQSFAFSATNLLRQTRQRWISLFADYNARIEIVYVEPAFEVILNQNKQRDEPVPEAVINGLLEKLEPPTWAEAHRVVLLEPEGAVVTSKNAIEDVPESE